MNLRASVRPFATPQTWLNDFSMLPSSPMTVQTSTSRPTPPNARKFSFSTISKPLSTSPSSFSTVIPPPPASSAWESTSAPSAFSALSA